MATKRKQWSDEIMKAAVQHVESDGASKQNHPDYIMYMKSLLGEE